MRRVRRTSSPRSRSAGGPVKPFEYHRAVDVDGAVALVAANPDARYLAGGTNLVDLMKLGVERPDAAGGRVRLPLRDVTDAPDGGAAHRRRRSATATSRPTRVVRERYPVLARAMLAGASGQLRNRPPPAATCCSAPGASYFQDTTQPCNKRAPGTRLRRPIGRAPQPGRARRVGRTAWPPTRPTWRWRWSPWTPRCTCTSRTGPHRPAGRVLPAGRRHPGPGGPPAPRRPGHRGHPAGAGVRRPAPRYRKVRERASFAFAIGSIAAAVDVRDGTVATCRVALGGGGAHAVAGVRAPSGRCAGPRPVGSFVRGRRRRAGRGPPAAATTRTRCRCPQPHRPRL